MRVCAYVWVFVRACVCVQARPLFCGWGGQGAATWRSASGKMKLICKNVVGSSEFMRPRLDATVVAECVLG